MVYKIKMENELYHHGVKGMKWGVRRYQNGDGSLTDKGIKRYAAKGYAKDSYNSNRTKVGKAFDAYSGASRQYGKIRADVSSKKANKARAEQYLKEKQTPVSSKVKKAVRNNVSNYVNKRDEKNRQRDEAVKQATKYFGPKGTATAISIKTAQKVAAKGTAAKIINSAANAYISSGRGNYYVNQGVHHARRAAINALSISGFADTIRGYSDIGKAYMYAADGRYK